MKNKRYKLPSHHFKKLNRRSLRLPRKKVRKDMRAIYKSRRELFADFSIIDKVLRSPTFKYSVISTMILIGFIGIFWRLFYVESITVKIDGNSSLISEMQLNELEDELNDYFEDGNNFFRRHFWIDYANIQETVMSKLYVSKVDLKRDNYNSRIVVEIKPKRVLADFVAPNINTVITQDGHILVEYEHLFNQTGAGLVIKSPYYAYESGIFLSSLNLTFINQFSHYLDSQGYELEEIRVTNNPHELILRITDYDFDIITLISRDPLEQAIALDIALNFFENPQRNQAVESSIVAVDDADVEAIIPAEYVDIRLINRVIYK